MAISDYLTQRPTTGITEGIQRGVQLGVAMDQSQAARTKSEALAQKQKQAQAMQNDLTSFSEIENPTTEQYSAMIRKYPALHEGFQSSLNSMEKKQKQNSIETATKIYAAAISGNSDLAKELLENQKTAAENSGDEKGAAGANAYLKMIEMNPNAAKASLGLMLSSAMGEEKFSSTFKILEEERRSKALQPGEIKKQEQEIIKFGIDNDLTKANAKKALADVEKLNNDAKKAVMELEVLKNQNVNFADNKEVFDAEEKLRKEYTVNTANFTTTQDAFRKISAAKSDAAGDLSLIFSFMKMLDPGSVVRESEFANAQNAGGVDDKIRNIYNKALSGERLSEGQRKTFIGQAKSLMKAAGKREKEVREGLTKVVDNYGLNKENVFTININEDGATEEEVTTETVSPKSYLKYAE